VWKSVLKRYKKQDKKIQQLDKKINNLSEEKQKLEDKKSKLTSNNSKRGGANVNPIKKFEKILEDMCKEETLRHNTITSIIDIYI
jgi:hypothetical protein